MRNCLSTIRIYQVHSWLAADQSVKAEMYSFSSSTDYHFSRYSTYFVVLFCYTFNCYSCFSDYTRVNFPASPVLFSLNRSSYFLFFLPLMFQNLNWLEQKETNSEIDNDTAWHEDRHIDYNNNRVWYTDRYKDIQDTLDIRYWQKCMFLSDVSHGATLKITHVSLSMLQFEYSYATCYETTRKKNIRQSDRESVWTNKMRRFCSSSFWSIISASFRLHIFLHCETAE